MRLLKNFSLCLIQKEAACFLFELERTASPIGLGRTSNLTGAESIAIEETVLFSRDSAALYFYILYYNKHAYRKIECQNANIAFP